MQAADKQVDKTGLPTVSVEVIFRKFFCRYNDLVSKIKKSKYFLQHFYKKKKSQNMLYTQV